MASRQLLRSITVHTHVLGMAFVGPQEPSIGQITVFQKMFLAPGFLVYGSVLIAASIVIVIFFAPRLVPL